MLEREEYFGWVIEEHAFLLLRSTDETECEIVSLAVHPEHQRKGLAKQLIKHAIQTLSSRSISTPPLRGSQNAQHFGGGYSTAITIHLEVRETNAPARALYASLGFTETGTRPNYYKDGNGSRVAAVMMTYKKD